MLSHRSLNVRASSKPVETPDQVHLIMQALELFSQLTSGSLFDRNCTGYILSRKITLWIYRCMSIICITCVAYTRLDTFSQIMCVTSYTIMPSQSVPVCYFQYSHSLSASSCVLLPMEPFLFSQFEHVKPNLMQPPRVPKASSNLRKPLSSHSTDQTSSAGTHKTTFISLSLTFP